MSVKAKKYVFGGHSFRPVNCGLGRTAADKAAGDIRDTNRMARVVQEGGKFCVLEGPISPTIKKRNAAAKVSGTKRRSTTKRKSA
jgi:hypothetical protein